MRISYLILLVFVSHQSSLAAGQDYVVNHNYSAGEYYIVNQQNPQWAEVLRDATQKKRDFLGIFPKCRTPRPPPPLLETPVSKKNYGLFFILGP